MQLWSSLEVTYLPLPIVSSASPTLSQPFDMRLVKNVYGVLFGLISVPYVRRNPSYQESLLHQPSTDFMDELSYSNGTKANVAKVQGSDAYEEGTRRLSLESSQHLT